MWQKRMVYVITVFFTEKCNFAFPSEEYFATTRGDIEKVKGRIRQDYSEDEIDEIIVSDEMEEREFWLSCSQ